MTMNEYEMERAKRIASNAAKMASLGIVEAATQLVHVSESAYPPKPKPAPRKRKMYEIEVEVRRSGRLHGEQPEYNEENLFAKELGIDRLDLISRPRRRRVGVDPSQLASIRERRVKEVDGEDAEVPRGPYDSGRGVRIQGGRVYDSKYGVTCHWCRQKTLEKHVTCTHPDCGEGKRLAVSFCKLCLRNRQGEDITQAEASGKWQCPRCRGNCGEGCASCCNCGPCRKALGLAPTGHIINLARAAGFENVHDYLVHQRTGESPEEIAARKRQAAWGAWLDVPFDSEATAAGSDADEQAAVPAAAAAAVQLEQRQEKIMVVPEGAGAAVLLYRALRWHLLSAAFCTATKMLAVPKRRPGRPAKAATGVAPKKATPAAKRKAAAAKPKPLAAPRRSARGAADGKEEAGKLATKVTAFFQAAAHTSAKKQAAVVVKPKAALKAASADQPRPGAGNRLGMRARK